MLFTSGRVGPRPRDAARPSVYLLTVWFYNETPTNPAVYSTENRFTGKPIRDRDGRRATGSNQIVFSVAIPYSNCIIHSVRLAYEYDSLALSPRASSRYAFIPGTEPRRCHYKNPQTYVTPCRERIQTLLHQKSDHYTPPVEYSCTGTSPVYCQKKKTDEYKISPSPTATPFKTVPAGTETKQNVKITFFFEKNEQFLEETNFWQECECKELEWWTMTDFVALELLKYVTVSTFAGKCRHLPISVVHDVIIYVFIY